MSYAVIQNAITTATQEQFPDGIVSKVGNDSYDYNGAIVKWHNQCVLLRNDADTLCYKCEVVDSQLNVVDGCIEFVDKRPQPEPEQIEE